MGRRTGRIVGPDAGADKGGARSREGPFRGPEAAAAARPRPGYHLPVALVVFLRGVNVGGHRTFRPSLLARRMKALGVVNVGAAGTFVVRAPVSQARLRAELLRRLPFQTEIAICRGRELLDAVAGHPFGGGPPRPGVVRFASILVRRPGRLPPMPVALPPAGRWLVRILAVDGRFAFGQYRRDMRTIGHLDAIGRVLGVPVTTRNWNTVEAIVEVLGDRA